MGWGAKISKQTKEVITAGLSDLILDSDYGVLKASIIGSVTTDGSGVADITHNLGYAPMYETWMQGSTYRFKTPRLYDGAADPVGGGVQAYAYSDSTYLHIRTLGANKVVYYYIFVDPLQ